MIGRCPRVILLVALSCVLGACGKCCLSDDSCCDSNDSCKGSNAPEPPPSFDRKCVDLRPGTGTDTCGEDSEPNEDFATAAVSTRGRPCGVETDLNRQLSDENDVDVIRTGGCHTSLVFPVLGSRDSRLEPTVHVKANIELRACIFPTCIGGESRFEDDEDQTFGCQERADDEDMWHVIEITRAYNGIRGCCRFGTGDVRAVMSCPLDSGDIDTFFWVDAGSYSKLSCAAYTLHWNI